MLAYRSVLGDNGNSQEIDYRFYVIYLVQTDFLGLNMLELYI
jgi:hypothetical protein